MQYITTFLTNIAHLQNSKPNVDVYKEKLREAIYKIDENLNKKIKEIKKFNKDNNSTVNEEKFYDTNLRIKLKDESINNTNNKKFNSNSNFDEGLKNKNLKKNDSFSFKVNFKLFIYINIIIQPQINKKSKLELVIHLA